MATATLDASSVQQMSTSQPWRPRINPWIVAMTVTLATFMEVLDSSIANVALPHIAGGLGATQDEATWVLTAYLVANAIILPAGAYMTTFIGRKKFYMICVALFGISSALCGLAPSLPLLVFFRILQGIGGGGLAPSEQAILADTFPPEKRGQAFAMYGLAVVVAPAIGPTLGGWITDNFDWRWIFFLNIPICLLSLFLTSRIVEDPPYVQEQVAGVAKGRHQARLPRLRSPRPYLRIARVHPRQGAGGRLVLLAPHHFLRDHHGRRLRPDDLVGAASSFAMGHRPIVNLTLFKRRSFAISFCLMFVLGFSLYGTTILIPQFVQTLLGYTAELAGLVLSPAGFMMMAMMPVVGVLSGKVDPRKLIGFGFIMLTALPHRHAHAQPRRQLRPPRLPAHLPGLRACLPLHPINTIAYIGVKQSENNDVSGLTNLARNIGGSCGTAFVATMLTRRTAAHETNMVRNLTPANPAFNAQVDALKGMYGHGAQASPRRTGVHLQPASPPGRHARLPGHHPVSGRSSAPACFRSCS